MTLALLVRLITKDVGLQRRIQKLFAYSKINITFLITICATFFMFKILEPGECLVWQAIIQVRKQRYLANHSIATNEANSELDCSIAYIALPMDHVY